MPARLRPFARALCVAAVASVVTLGPSSAQAADVANPTRVPLETWAAKFCIPFAAYQTDALAARQQLQTAFTGVADSAAVKTATTALGDAFTKTSASAEAAATAATADGVPDVKNGKALAVEIEQTLTDTGKVYAKMATKSSSLPASPEKLSVAARKISSDIADALDPSGPHARRLKKLDRGNKIVTALSADPTCAAAAAAAGVTVPATPATTAP